MKRQSKKTAKRYALPLIIIVAAVFIVFILTQQPKAPSAYAGLEARIATALEVAKLTSNRPDYLPPIVYQNLPPFPKDFYEIDTLITFGIKKDLTDLGPEYYKQPEFYPTWEEILPHYQNPDQKRRGIFGYGIYPGDIGVETSGGGSFKIVTFAHSGFQIETYQGMGLAVTYPDFASIPTQDLQSSLPVYQNTSKIGDYFTVTFNPEAFALTPAFPIFESGWTQRIEINVKVAENTPRGRYVIGVNPTTPPNNLRTEWVNKYRLKYVDAGGHFVGRPFFQLTVDVV